MADVQTSEVVATLAPVNVEHEGLGLITVDTTPFSLLQLAS
jgi:hypothetical protein